MAQAVVKVIEDEKVSRSSGKDFGLVILGLLTLQGSSQPRDQTQVSHIAGGFFTS